MQKLVIVILLLIGCGGLDGNKYEAQISLSAGESATDVVHWTSAIANTIAVTVVAKSDLPTRPYGIVRWRYKNIEHVTSFDIGQGTQFNITASELAVSVGLEVLPQGTCVFSASLIPNGVSSKTDTTRTIFIDNLGQGLTRTIKPPAFAKSIVGFHRESAGVAPALTIYLMDSGRRVISFLSLGANENLNNPLVLPNDVHSIVIGSPISNIATLRVVFGLDL